MNYFLSSADDVLSALKSSKEGLTDEEAAIRLEKDGKNKLAEGKKDSLLKRFFSQMKDPMIIILLVAAAVSAVTDMAEKGRAAVPTDSRRSSGEQGGKGH